MAPQYEHLILRALSNNGRWNELMDNPQVKAYVRDLGLAGWRIASSTANDAAVGYTMIVWFEREREERSVPTPTAPEGVEVMPGYL